MIKDDGELGRISEMMVKRSREREVSAEVARKGESRGPEIWEGAKDEVRRWKI